MNNTNELNWYAIQGAPNRIWALYIGVKPMGYKPKWFDSDLLGFIERIEDGSWNCFALRNELCGNEPNRKYAMELVYNTALHRTGRVGDRAD